MSRRVKLRCAAVLTGLALYACGSAGPASPTPTVPISAFSLTPGPYILHVTGTEVSGSNPQLCTTTPVMPSREVNVVVEVHADGTDYVGLARQAGSDLVFRVHATGSSFFFRPEVKGTLTGAAFDEGVVPIQAARDVRLRVEGASSGAITGTADKQVIYGEIFGSFSFADSNSNRTTCPRLQLFFERAVSGFGLP
jgi:hypothetical protein